MRRGRTDQNDIPSKGHALSSISMAVLGLALSLSIGSCSGGGGASSSGTAPVSPPPPPPPPIVGLYTPPSAQSLSPSDIQTIIAQAAEEALAQNLPSVITVSDRVGNILAVFRMNGTSATTKIKEGKIINGASTPNNLGLQGVDVPHELASISKAITGAYLSSSGNAFSTRTASMIVQEHFPPSANTVGLESGPLFGVQFSQLPCSDFMQRDLNGTNFIGPKRAPLGLSADPGGFPLYKNGVVVGGIGVSGDADYGFDLETVDIDNHTEELIAVAGMAGFAAPLSIRADRISVDGTTLRFTDRDESDLISAPSVARDYSTLDGTIGSLVRVRGYFEDGTPTIRAGQSYTQSASGIRAAHSGEYTNPDVFIMVDGADQNRYPPQGGMDGTSVTNPLTGGEVRTIVEQAFDVMSRSRAQIRKPLDSRAQVSISVVDTHGTILAMVRAPDAPIFGTDVSLQKARTATFFSNKIAGIDLGGVTTSSSVRGGGQDTQINERVADVRQFIGDQNALTGTHAFADRSGGNLSRPYFPDGEVGTSHGPLSVSIANFSPFANGLQEELIEDNIIEHVVYTAGGAADTAQRCTFLPDVVAGQNRLQNGIQIFPGSVPIYRDGELIGGIGVSGDGIDQDDMISFLGVHNAGEQLGTLGNAAPEIRASNIVIPVNGEDIRLRYVSCPFAPFLDTNEQNPCEGK